MTDPIVELARSFEDDSFFLAGALRDYARSRRFDDHNRVDALGCAAETLLQIALCHHHDIEGTLSTFDQEDALIAARFRVIAAVLAEAARGGPVSGATVLTTGSVPTSGHNADVAADPLNSHGRATSGTEGREAAGEDDQ